MILDFFQVCNAEERNMNLQLICSFFLERLSGDERFPWQVCVLATRKCSSCLQIPHCKGGECSGYCKRIVELMFLHYLKALGLTVLSPTDASLWSRQRGAHFYFCSTWAKHFQTLWGYPPGQSSRQILTNLIDCSASCLMCQHLSSNWQPEMNTILQMCLIRTRPY